LDLYYVIFAGCHSCWPFFNATIRWVCILDMSDSNSAFCVDAKRLSITDSRRIWFAVPFRHCKDFNILCRKQVSSITRLNKVTDPERKCSLLFRSHFKSISICKQDKPGTGERAQHQRQQDPTGDRMPKHITRGTNQMDE
jgi:hypothetical protein